MPKSLKQEQAESRARRRTGKYLYEMHQKYLAKQTRLDAKRQNPAKTGDANGQEQNIIP